MITEKELKKIESRRKGATAGLWRPLVNGKGICILVDYQIAGTMEMDPKVWPKEDQMMIAFDHEDVPLLISEIRRLRGLVNKRKE